MVYITDRFDNELTRLLENGGVGVLPTDTIYGLSSKASNKLGVERLYKLKGRQPNKPFVILISKPEQLLSLGIDPHQADPAVQYWPGSLSVIFESEAPEWLHRGAKCLAVRLPDHQPLLNLISQTGPLISTSVNLEGAEPAKTISEAREYFGGRLDFYVDAGKLESIPSTIAKLKNSKWEIIRQGTVKIN